MLRRPRPEDFDSHDQNCPQNYNWVCPQSFVVGHLGCSATNGTRYFMDMSEGSACTRGSLRDDICRAGLQPSSFKVTCYSK